MVEYKCWFSYSHVGHPAAWARYSSGKSPNRWKVTRARVKHHGRAMYHIFPNSKLHMFLAYTGTKQS